MQQHPDFGRLYSASDLVAHIGCQHRTTLDLRRLEGWNEQPAQPDEANRLVQEYGNRHEANYLNELQAQGLQIVEIDKNAPLGTQLSATRNAMNAGADVIFQATLLQSPFVGYADFLMRVPVQSKLGDYSYEVADTKLARSNRAKFQIQLGLYAEMLATEQGVLPNNLQIVLGPGVTLDRRIAQQRTEDCIYYVRDLSAAFKAFVTHRPQTQALPNAACTMCHWRQHCEAEWQKNDHVCLVANIRRTQIDRLGASGITTTSALAGISDDREIESIESSVLAKLKKQADLQRNPLDSEGKLRMEYLPPRKDGLPHGLALLPKPDAGDLYFDMEGFPHEPGGLEYLFGVGWHDNAATAGFEFRAFWAHNRQEEKVAFEEFMDFVEQHLKNHPDAHIYHYAPYEVTAIRRLSGAHNTRTEFFAQLMRENRLVDLYKVVRSGLLLAVPSYSIKKIESYYGARHAGNVATAGESIVKYELFRVTDDQVEKSKCMAEIEDYNRDDVKSTLQLHEWLESIRPENTCRPEIENAAQEDEEATKKQLARKEHLARQQAAILKLTEWAKHDLDSRAPLAKLLGQLLGFYWRCKLPTLWRFYERKNAEAEALIDDLECLAMLHFTGNKLTEKKSIRYEYKVPQQETKLETGAIVKCLTDDIGVSGFVYDESAGIASFKRAATKPPPPEYATICADDDISTAPKLEAIYHYVESLCANQTRDDAVRQLLSRALPRVKNKHPDATLVEETKFESVLNVIENLDHSYLVIQGPPGSGKTTIASKIIAQLLKKGKSVAITSNSHPAINNLLRSSWQQCKLNDVSVQAAVVKTDNNLPNDIQVLANEQVDSGTQQLVGGTAWLFCRETQRKKWDYLFVDEASQVSLADVVAAAPCAHNIVLLGDQMQLPQPIQGDHPDDSGLSALEFLMQGEATVAPSRGIFLASTFRMHPHLCAPVSTGVYEGRLHSDKVCEDQRLVLSGQADPALRPTGVAWLPVGHQNRSQRAPEEVDRIAKLYSSLLKQQWVNQKGEQKTIGPADILVLAPYNAQVRALKRKLGDGARVGTVDKFQGQEAAVAIISMTSSDADSMPRGLDFLFSINRLNVAVSRARCLAVIVASPAIRTPPCNTVEDVRRVNFFARLADAGGANARPAIDN